MNAMSVETAAKIHHLSGVLRINRASMAYCNMHRDADWLAAGHKLYSTLAEDARRALKVDEVLGLLLVCKAAIDGHVDFGSAVDLDGAMLDPTISALEQSLSNEPRLGVAAE